MSVGTQRRTFQDLYTKEILTLIPPIFTKESNITKKTIVLAVTFKSDFQYNIQLYPQVTIDNIAKPWSRREAVTTECPRLLWY